MTEHWDEFFLKLHNQQTLKEQLDVAENDENWMMLSIDEAIEGISKGLLTLPDGQEIQLQTLYVFENQLAMSLPSSLIAEARARKAKDQPGSYVVQDKSNGILFGLHQTKQELHPTQVELYLQQVIEQTSRLQSEMKLVDQKIIHIQGAAFGCYESLFVATPFPYYQITFVFSWREKACIGSCQFKLEDAPLWYPLTYAMLHTANWSAHA
ncbi:hypothetical protein [Paenibacillus glacialis]|uniref:Uncharacterized protein n=1 Tax=Paenibacillus glacialis TaxID=494026 RepID=A0A162K8A1_9BACL|nr:hypothetical protein [Paenibacillus glacialis]OAB42118.1 hypothetical protein PGLA_13710 [Paenibacillus glacialis]